MIPIAKPLRSPRSTHQSLQQKPRSRKSPPVCSRSASSATFSAGLFLSATPTLRAARGPAPTRPQAASPIFRAALVQTSAYAPPFPLRPAPLQGWGDPSACSCYPPPSPGGVRHVCHMPLPQQRQLQRSNDHGNQEEQRRIPDPRPSGHLRVHNQPASHV